MDERLQFLLTLVKFFFLSDLHSKCNEVTYTLNLHLFCVNTYSFRHFISCSRSGLICTLGLFFMYLKQFCAALRGFCADVPHPKSKTREEGNAFRVQKVETFRPEERA